MGLLRVRVMKGINLAVRDVKSSNPYVVLTMGEQRLKTRVIDNNLNPVWNEELTFSIAPPILPVKLNVYDKDTFTKDDKMGEAVFEIQTLIECARLNLEGVPSGAVIRTVAPSEHNCLAEESLICRTDGKVIQDLRLRLRNVECGEVELQLEWIIVPGSMEIQMP
ncbi:hypothetical protein AMTR_s00007p00250120 [Amborella trichopoda]|uniref:C2 domain-containing protein n=2 Tax=Amborella trichopoda TaxID=13333 RepID=W1PCM5_AMBTC|nr:hypothetical protein AMTR_s00007p00250120 [Amborella trichopoda]